MSTLLSPSDESSGKSLLGILMLIATLLAVVFEAPALAVPWQGQISYPITTGLHDGSLVVTSVLPEAQAKGVRTGMRVDANGQSSWRLTKPLDGSTVTVIDGFRRIVLNARRRPLDTNRALVNTFAIILSLILIVFSGVLCYRRPGVMTSAFWLFAVGNIDASWVGGAYTQIATEPFAHAINAFVQGFMGGWTFYPMVWFALRFPDDRLRSRGTRVCDALWTIISLCALAWFIFHGWTASQNTFWTYEVPQNVPAFAALAAFLWIYAKSTQAVRQRAVWAIAGFVAAIIFQFASNIVWESTNALFLSDVTELIAAVCPFALVYSVLRHHLLDITFVVNRALVYTALTAFIVAVVGLVDWLVGKYLYESRAALALEAMVTIGVGFILQRVHGVLENIVDRVVFASRHAAERHIERVIAALAFAKSHKAILDAIVEEPRVSLDLTSAGVFISGRNSLELKNSHGWHVAGEPAIEFDDPLARLLLSERKVVDIPEAHWHVAIAGFAPGQLQIAVPLFARHDLLGIAFYSSHRNGSTLDPEERALLQRLCDAAAVAYEAVELSHAREELAALRPAFDLKRGV